MDEQQDSTPVAGLRPVEVEHANTNTSEALVAVVTDTYEVGQPEWLWTRTPGQPPPYDVTPLSTAIATDWPVDKFFVTGVAFKDGKAVRRQPRVNKDQVQEVRAQDGYEIRHLILAADVDTPQHIPITAPQIEGVQAWTRRLTTAGWYTTRAGVRIVQPLTTWLTSEQYEDVIESWLDMLRGIFPRTWVVDYKCRDSSRHFRLPTVRRRGVMSTPTIDFARMVPIEPPPTPRPRPARSASPATAPGSVPAMDQRVRRATQYIRAVPVPECGQGECHEIFLKVALHAVKGFLVDEASAIDIVREWASTSRHGWSDHDIEVNVRGAARVSKVPDGYLLQDVPLEGGEHLGVEDYDAEDVLLGGDAGDGGPGNSPPPDTSAPASTGGSTGTAPPSTGPAAARRYNTDLGNAERLVRLYGQDIRYVGVWGKWLVWDGIRWQLDETEQVLRLAQLTARSIYREAAAEPDEARRRALAGHAKATESTPRMKAMITQAAALPGISVKPADLDTDLWLLNCRNGTLNLRTGLLQPHARQDMITKVTNVAYDADATCPGWQTFLDRVQPKTEVQSFLGLLSGYALTGDVGEHILPIHCGKGRNGKGVFTNTRLFVMGDYAKQIPTELLMMKKGDAHPTEKTVLFGCRFAAAVESEEGRSMNVALVKQFTGGDKVSARRMREDYWEFAPVHKLELSTNHRPVIRETADAIWERVQLIPWEIQIPKGERDKKLEGKLKAEGPGILAWMVRHCLAWQRDGLKVPDCVRVATQAYRDAEDLFAMFLDERCVQEPRAESGATDLQEGYKGWAEQRNERELSHKALSSKLEERGFTKGRDSRTGRVLWHGVRLRDDVPPGQPGGPEGAGEGVTSDELEEMIDKATRGSAEESEGSEGRSGLTPHESSLSGSTGKCLRILQTLRPDVSEEGSSSQTSTAIEQPIVSASAGLIGTPSAAKMPAGSPPDTSRRQDILQPPPAPEGSCNDESEWLPARLHETWEDTFEDDAGVSIPRLNVGLVADDGRHLYTFHGGGERVDEMREFYQRNPRLLVQVQPHAFSDGPGWLVVRWRPDTSVIH